MLVSSNHGENGLKIVSQGSQKNPISNKMGFFYVFFLRFSIFYVVL